MAKLGEYSLEVLVCDDHPIVASAVAMTIETAFNANVHIASSYREAKQIVAQSNDVKLCLLDIRVPGEDTWTEVQDLKQRLPEAKFILFSGSELDSDLMLALDLGLHGFLPKSSTTEVVIAALSLVLAGGTYLPIRVGQLAIGNSQPNEVAPPRNVEERKAPGVPFYGKLTDRQTCILQQLAEGRSNKEIARHLLISPATVKAHVANIIALLGASNRTEAASRARGLGLIADN